MRRVSALGFLTWLKLLKVKAVSFICLLHLLDCKAGKSLQHNLFIVTEQSCYNEDGRDYRGIASHTTSKQECLPWNRQVAVKSSDHSELIGGHNYCRNPGGVEIQPWCFVAGSEGPNSRPRREFCSLPKCCKIYLTIFFFTLFTGIKLYEFPGPMIYSYGLRHQLAVHYYSCCCNWITSDYHSRCLLRPPIEMQSQKLIGIDQRTVQLWRSHPKWCRFQYGPFGWRWRTI